MVSVLPAGAMSSLARAMRLAAPPGKVAGSSTMSPITADYSQRTCRDGEDTLRRVPHVQKQFIGRILRRKREALGISQEELAARSEVDRSYISILERGLKSPTIETLEKICAALGTLPEHVIEEARKR